MRQEAGAALVPQHPVEPREECFVFGDHQQAAIGGEHLLGDARDHLLRGTSAQLVEIDLHAASAARSGATERYFSSTSATYSSSSRTP